MVRQMHLCNPGKIKSVNFSLESCSLFEYLKLIQLYSINIIHIIIFGLGYKLVVLSVGSISWGW